MYYIKILTKIIKIIYIKKNKNYFSLINKKMITHNNNSKMTIFKKKIKD